MPPEVPAVTVAGVPGTVPPAPAAPTVRETGPGMEAAGKNPNPPAPPPPPPAWGCAGSDLFLLPAPPPPPEKTVTFTALIDAGFVHVAGAA